MRFRFGSIRLSLALLLGAAAPIIALEVRFTITDRLGQAVPAARICLQEDATQCQVSDAQGQSLFSPTVAARPTPAAPREPAISLRAGDLFIDAPLPMNARLRRYATDGRRLGPALSLSLHAGENRIPEIAPAAGLAFFRLETEHARYLFASVSGAGPSARLDALGKVATANLHAFTISKSGFQTFTYRPRKETDTALIRLSADGDTGIPYVGLIRARLLGIDTAKHSLNYAYAQPSCNGSTPTSTEAQSSLPFWMQGGKWYFPAGNCYGVALAKDGAGIYGLWQSQGLEPLPAGLFPVTCDPVRDSVVTSVPNLFFLTEGGGWDIDLRSDSLTIRIRRRACLGDQLVSDPTALDGLNGHLGLVANTCQEVVLKNAKNENATYAFSTAADSLRVTFAYTDKTCRSNGVPLTLDSTAPKACPESQAGTLLADTTWQSCVRATGFSP